MARALTSMRRVREVLDEKPAISSPEHALTEVPDGSVDFDHVGFRYSASAQKDVLSDVTLHLPTGSTVGVLGATGSGKTTLVQLIARLYDVTSGGVAGWRPRRARVRPRRRCETPWASCSRRTCCSAAPSARTCSGVRPDAADDELLEACRMACVGRVPATACRRVSTGTWARAASTSPAARSSACASPARCSSARRVLIFDDSTSAVDMATEAKIRAHLAGPRGRHQDRHRPARGLCYATPTRSSSWTTGASTLSGTHEELLRRRPHLPGALRVPDRQRHSQRKPARLGRLQMAGRGQAPSRPRKHAPHAAGPSGLHGPCKDAPCRGGRPGHGERPGEPAGHVHDQAGGQRRGCRGLARAFSGWWR